MRCVMCNRPIFTAAVSVPTRNGLVGYGPVCARKAGLLQNQGPRITHTRKSPPRPKKPHCRVLVVREEQTLDLFTEGLTC